MKYIVDFHNDAAQADIDGYLSVNGCTVIKEWDNFDKVYLVEAASEPPAASIVAFVKDDEYTLAIKPKDIEFNPYHNTVNPNSPQITISTTEKKDWWKNYSLAQPVFDAPTAQYSQKGSNINVYIMDSGIDATHPEFEGVSITNLYSVTDNFLDLTGHGTALASAIAGTTCGISSAKLKIVKIFEPNHATLQSQFLDALDAIMADLPEGHFGILNCSWAVERNEWIEFKLRECIDDGLWIVAAAGNSGEPIGDVTPAAMPEAFTVGSYTPDLVPADFSNYTETSAISVTGGNVNHGVLDGWAPGVDIWVANANYTGTNGFLPSDPYGYVAGTSISTAITVGIIAHNLSDFCYSDGTKLPEANGFFIAGPGSIPYLVTARKDLLDLSDPKYADSKNSLVTMINQPNTMQIPDEVSMSIRAGEKQTLARVFNPSLTKSASFIDPLPDNFTILPHGSVHGEPTLEQGPTGDDLYKIYTAKLKRVGLDDVEEIVTIKIYVTTPNFQPTDLPEDHEINILFSFGCNGAAAIECQLIFIPACFDRCGGFYCCGGSVKESMCNCRDAFGTYKNA